MGKRLNGSAKTGKKIMSNIQLFSYSYQYTNKSEKFVTHHFTWNFDGQIGTAFICIDDQNNIINSSSLIGFPRPLGLYGDDSLLTIFQRMVKSIEKVVYK